MNKTTIVAIMSVVVAAFMWWQHSCKQRDQQVDFFTQESNRKRILIFTSSGGRGHESATEALHAYLDDEYDVKEVYVLRDVLGGLDFVYMLTCGLYHSESFYNYCIINDHTWVVPLLVWIGEWFFWLRRAKITALIQDYIVQQNPDLIISVIPMINGITLDAAQALQKPFWVIPTDLNASKVVHQITDPSYDKFFFNVAYDDEALRQTFAHAGINSSQLTYAGFPVRPSFIQGYDLQVLKQRYKVPDDKPVVMMLMGGLGSHQTVQFTREIAQSLEPIHLIICIGKNESARAQIDLLEFAPQASYSIIGFTQKIAEIMAMSDLLITKSGGLTVNEALYMNLPLLLDGSSQGLSWERFNREFIVAQQCGLIIEDVSKIRSMVESLVRDKITLATLQENIQKLEKKNPQEEVLRAVQSMFKD